MSKKREFYASLPRLNGAVLETLIDLAERERDAWYGQMMTCCPAYPRQFWTLDATSLSWRIL